MTPSNNNNIWRGPWGWGVPLLAALLLAWVALSDTNQGLFLAINHWAAQFGQVIWPLITTFGDSLVIFSLGLLFVERYPRLLWTLIITSLMAGLLAHGLKEWLLVMRPPYELPPETFTLIGTRYIAVSFPSGHTTAYFALAGVLCMQPTLANRYRFALLAFGVLVGVSRIAVGIHWPMDVLGGAMIGYGSAVLSSIIASRLPWGESLEAQRLFAAPLVITALLLIFTHDSGYDAARPLEIAIAVLVLVIVAPRLWRLYLRRPAELSGMEVEKGEPVPMIKSIGGLLLRLGITAFIFVMIFRAIELDEVMAVMNNIVPRLLLLGIIFQLLSTLLASYRWYLVMQPLGFGQGFGFYLRSYFKGSFFNQGLPTSIGGDAIRVLDVARTGFRKRDAFYGVFIDRVLGLVGLLILNLAANAWSPDLLPRGVFIVINLLVAGGIAGFVVLWLLRYWHLLERWTPTRMFHTISTRLSLVLVNWRTLGVQLGLSVMVHLLSLIAIFLIGRSVELNYDLLTFLVVAPPAILLTLIPISLAGWGVREGAMIGLFTLVGADKTLVLSMSILYGIVLIISSLPGFYVYLTGRSRI
jgi:uncharacterized membrane protein YbhN (UPF0104 family)/membrane-associated phospholipid phosphatase